jgi:hypothetical protein
VSEPGWALEVQQEIATALDECWVGNETVETADLARSVFDALLESGSLVVPTDPTDVQRLESLLEAVKQDCRDSEGEPYDQGRVVGIEQCIRILRNTAEAKP